MSHLRLGLHVILRPTPRANCRQRGSHVSHLRRVVVDKENGLQADAQLSGKAARIEIRTHARQRLQQGTGKRCGLILLKHSRNKGVGLAKERLNPCGAHMLSTQRHHAALEDAPHVSRHVARAEGDEDTALAQ